MFAVDDFFALLVKEGTPTDHGLRLPTERDLAELGGLSRATVREYLAALRIMGLLTKVHGSANVLHRPTGESAGAIYSVLLQLQHVTFADVDEAREMFEIGMIRFVARRIAPGDIERLRLHVREMSEASAAGNNDAAIEADLAFHQLLFSSLSNPIVDFAFDGLRVNLRDTLRVRRAQALTAEVLANNGTRPCEFKTDAVHTQIVEALEAHDGEAAVAAMALHYEQFRDLVTEAPLTKGHHT
jgi:GntR family transcriptional repressor for pyruvate dehydrogenase complex